MTLDHMDTSAASETAHSASNHSEAMLHAGSSSLEGASAANPAATKRKVAGEVSAVAASDSRAPDLKSLFASAVLSSGEDEALPAKPFDLSDLSCANGYSRLSIELPYNNEVAKNDLRTLMLAARAGYYGTLVFDKGSDSKRQNAPKAAVNIIERKQLERLLKHLSEQKI